MVQLRKMILSAASRGHRITCVMLDGRGCILSSGVAQTADMYEFLDKLIAQEYAHVEKRLEKMNIADVACVRIERWVDTEKGRGRFEVMIDGSCHGGDA